MRLKSALIILLVCLGLAASAPSAQAGSVQVGYSDLSWDIKTWTNNGADLAQSMATAKFVGGDFVRINASWYSIAPNKPSSTVNPSSFGYNWDRLDTAVKQAVALHLNPHIMVYGAPHWAQTAGAKQPYANNGAWYPYPSQLRTFAKTLATRYSGYYPDPKSPGSFLPRVSSFEAWNEPNTTSYLAPQIRNGIRIGPLRYRGMLNAFYEGIKSASPAATVVAGGTAPRGVTETNQGTPSEGTPPMVFWKQVFCLTDKLTRANSCPDRAKFDVFSHHPINLKLGGFDSATEASGNVYIADMPRLIAVLRAAEKRDTVIGDNHPVWATEMWWETSPPDPARGVSPILQARFMTNSLYQLDQFGVDRGIFLQVRDTKSEPVEEYKPFHSYQTGIFNHDWSAKTSAIAMAFPFNALERIDSHKLRFWGIPYRGGSVKLQRLSNGQWQTFKTFPVTAGESFLYDISFPAGTYTFRAVNGTINSINYTVKADWIEGTK